MDVNYTGRMVAGSPITTEVFDPSKVVVEASKGGMVDQTISFDGEYFFCNFSKKIKSF